MYSGSDSAESQNYAQWALNPSTYQNMSNEQVDWAALAQQWIIMKEAGPPPVIPTEQKSKPKKEQLHEGGEAPMDVENEKEDSLSEWNSVPNQQTNDWTWNPQNQTWGWNNTWTPPTGVPPPVPLKPPLLPTPANYNQFNAPPESSSDNANFPGYSTAANSDYSSGYWTSAGGSKQIKPHNRRFSKVNVPRPVQPIISETQPTLDASKRKQLPAWIREGLEKMERDKQKQLEREKEKQERDEYNEKLKQNEKETMELLKSTIKEQQRSKFESDGEYSDGEPPEKKTVAHQPEPAILTPAEQMMNVRRTMTEILLKVTNREIETICREELQRHHKKHKASDHRVSAPSGANVTAKLGLGIYGGGSDSSSSETDDDNREDQRDSDSELKDSIKRKKAEFSKTEREIEDKLAEAESRKQEAVSRSPSPDTNDNDTQVDAKVQGLSEATDLRRERINLRVPGNRKQRVHSHSKSSVKRAKSRSSSSSSDDASSYADSRKRSSGHRSSTSSSGGRDSKKTFKRGRSRSTSRSRTPEKSRHKISKTTSKRSRSRSNSKQRKDGVKGRYSRRSRSRSRSRRSRSSSYRRRRSRSRNRRSRSPYSKSRRTRSRSISRSRKRRSRSSSSGRGKRSRRR